MHPMAFLMTIRAGTEAEYDRWHHAIWPEMLAELPAAGAQAYSLFRRGTQIFAYLEVDDLTQYQRSLVQSAVAVRWEAVMRDILLREVDPATDFPPLLPEVFYFHTHNPGGCHHAHAE